MAITHVQTQVTWSAANYSDITSSSNATSDVVTMNATDVKAILTLGADNQGTPASGDTVDFYILYSTGDPFGAGSDVWDTVAHAHHLARLNTYSTEGGEDPARLSVEINPACESFKIYAVNNSGGRTIRVGCELGTIRG